MLDFLNPGIADTGADLSTAKVYHSPGDDVPDSSSMLRSLPSPSKLKLLLGIGILSTTLLARIT